MVFGITGNDTHHLDMLAGKPGPEGHRDTGLAQIFTRKDERIGWLVTSVINLEPSEKANFPFTTQTDEYAQIHVKLQATRI